MKALHIIAFFGALVLASCSKGNVSENAATKAQASCDQFLGTWHSGRQQWGAMADLVITKAGEKYIMTGDGLQTHTVRVSACENGSLSGGDLGNADIVAPGHLIFSSTDFHR